MRKTIPYYRKIVGMTQKELADLVHVHRTYISAIEQGKKFPSGKLLYHLADILGVDVWKLFCED